MIKVLNQVELLQIEQFEDQSENIQSFLSFEQQFHKNLFYRLTSDQYHRIIKLQVMSNVTSMNIKIQNEEQEPNSNANKSLKKKSNKLNSLDYRGMTLQEYFRLSQKLPHSLVNEIKETEQQNVCQSKQAKTPCFNGFNVRQKNKTQTCEELSLLQDKLSQHQKQKIKEIFPFQNKTKQLKVPQIRQKKDNNKNNKNKRAITLGNQYKDHLNRSTITSFYQIEDKQKRMLQKVRNQKERINQMKLSDAFFITKYAYKFQINHQNAF